MKVMLFDAEVKDGKIVAEEGDIDGKILSEGTADSEGVAITQGLEAWYLTNTSSDVKAIIEALSEMHTKTIQILQGLDANTVPKLTQAASILELQLLANEFESMKDELK